jgi:hypothetical protein
MSVSERRAFTKKQETDQDRMLSSCSLISHDVTCFITGVTRAGILATVSLLVSDLFSLVFVAASKVSACVYVLEERAAWLAPRQRCIP